MGIALVAVGDSYGICEMVISHNTPSDTKGAIGSWLNLL